MSETYTGYVSTLRYCRKYLARHKIVFALLCEVHDQEISQNGEHIDLSGFQMQTGPDKVVITVGGSVQSLNYQNCQSKRVAAGSIHGCERTSTSNLPEWLIHADGTAKIITTRLLMCDSIPHSRFTKVIGGIRRGQCHFLLPEVQAKG